MEPGPLFLRPFSSIHCIRVNLERSMGSFEKGNKLLPFSENSDNLLPFYVNFERSMVVVCCETVLGGGLKREHANQMMFCVGELSRLNEGTSFIKSVYAA